MRKKKNIFTKICFLLVLMLTLSNISAMGSEYEENQRTSNGRDDYLYFDCITGLSPEDGTSLDPDYLLFAAEIFVTVRLDEADSLIGEGLEIVFYIDGLETERREVQWENETTGSAAIMKLFQFSLPLEDPWPGLADAIGDFTWRIDLPSDIEVTGITSGTISLNPPGIPPDGIYEHEWYWYYLDVNLLCEESGCERNNDG